MTDQELDQEALFGCMTSLMNVKQWMIRYSGVMKCCHRTFDDIKVEQKNSSRRRIYKSKWATDFSSVVIFLFFTGNFYVHSETILVSQQYHWSLVHFDSPVL